MPEPVEVRVDATPNPNALKFTVNRELAGGGPRTISSRLEAFGSPLAARLLDVPGVKSLFLLRDFVTVTREPGANWEPLADAVTRAIEEHFTSEER